MKLKQQIACSFFCQSSTQVFVWQPIYFILFFIFIRFGIKQNGKNANNNVQYGVLYTVIFSNEKEKEKSTKLFVYCQMVL